MVNCFNHRCDFTTEPTPIPVEAAAGDLADRMLAAWKAFLDAVSKGDWLRAKVAFEGLLNLIAKALLNDPEVQALIQAEAAKQCKDAYEGAATKCPSGCNCLTGWVPFQNVQFTGLGHSDDWEKVYGTALVSCSVNGMCIPVRRKEPKPEPPDIEMMTSMTVPGGTYSRSIAPAAIGGGNALSEAFARKQRDMDW